MSDSERRLRAVVQQAGIGIVVADLGGRVLEANEAFHRLLGYPVPELVGKTAEEITHPDDRQAGLERWDELTIGASESYEVEKRYLRSDGSAVWARVNARVVRRADGSPEVGVAIVEDADARRRIEEALREAEARYRTLVEQLPLVTYIDALDDRSSNIYTSPQLEAILGYTVDEWQSDPDLFVKILHTDDRERVLEETRAANESGGRFLSEYRLVAQDGQIVWVRDEAVTVRGPDGEPLYSQGYLLDITDRRTTEEALRASEERFRRMADDAPVLVWTTDAAGKVDFFSKTWLELVGRSPETELGLGWKESLHPDDVETAFDGYGEAIRAGVPWECEYRLRRPDGAYRWIYDTGKPQFSSDGSLLGYVGVGVDVTERKNAEQALLRRESILEAVAGVAGELVRAPHWHDADFLRPLGEGACVSRVYLYSNQLDESGSLRGARIAEWTAPGFDAQSNGGKPVTVDYATTGLDWLRTTLGAGEVVAGPIRSLPESGRSELERGGARSVLLVPLTVDGDWWGHLGFDDCVSDRVWEDAEVDALRVAAGILSATIQRDVASRRLRETGETLGALVQASPAAIVGFDRAGNVLLWNRAAEEMFGWSADEASGRFNPAVDAEATAAFLALLERGLRGESWRNVEQRRRRRDGTPIDVSESSAPLSDADGEIVGMASIFLDITEEKLIRDTLRQSEARFAAFMDATPAVAFAKDADGRYVFVNEPWRGLFGHRPEAILGKTDHEIFLPDDAEAFVAADNEARAAGRAVERIETAPALDGPRTFFTVKFPFEDSTGAQCVGGVAIDVTESEQAKATLLQTTQTLEAIVDSSPLAILTFDELGCVTRWNEAAEHIFGWTADEAVGRFNPILPEGEEEGFRSAVELALKGRSWRNVEVVRRRKDGVLIDVSVSSAPLRDGSGETIGMVAMVADISARKRAEARLAAQHAVTRVLAASATVEEAVPVVLDAVCEGLGWELGALWLVDRGKGVLQAVAARTGDPALEAFARLSLDIELVRGNGLPGRVWEAGESIWVVDVPAATTSVRGTIATTAGIESAIAVPIESGGELIGVVEFYTRTTREPDDDMLAMLTSIGRQIGQFVRRVQADASVREREERFRTLVANLPGVVYRCVPGDGWTIEYVSDSVRDLCGHPASDFVHGRVRSYRDVIHEDDRRRIALLIDEAVRRREPFELEYRIVRVDGSVRWVAERGQPIVGPGGDVLWLDGAIFDVTEQKRAAEELAQAKALLDSVVDNLPTPLFLKDADELRFVRVNRAFEELMGVPRDELIGMSDFDLVPRDQAEFFVATDREVVHRQELLDVPDEPVETRELGVRWLHTRKVPILDEGGRSRYLLGISIDVTEQKRAAMERERLLAAEQHALHEAQSARAQLAAQNEALRDIDRMKDEFVALVSHELRTPLTSILGYLELLLEGDAGDVSDDQRGFLAIIERNAQRLLRLVGDLLFVAQIEAGKLAIERTPVDLLALSQDCLEAARPRAAEKQIELGLEGAGVPGLLGDRVRLAQLLDNLVSNAIKFTPEGGRVAVRLSHREAHATLEVSDTGMGIPRAEQEQLFQRFFRSSSATARAIQGTGLGLTITKAIAEAHGGSVAVESEEGKGTTFVVGLPLIPPTDSTST